MKKFLIVIAIIAIALPASAQTIKGSKHDLGTNGFSATYRATNTGEICQFCHTPHNSRIVTGAGTATNALPLWNRGITATTLASGGYGIYGSVTMNATQTSWGSDANSSSALCMSCHDGSVGVGAGLIVNPRNATGQVTPSNSTVFITGNSNLGAGSTALTNDHPVNFVYDAGLRTADGGLNDPASNAVKNLLIGTYVQCASCHDVHNPTYVPFLRMSNLNSELCLTCHAK